MRSFGGAAILMRRNLKHEDRAALDKVTYLIGDADVLDWMPSLPSRTPFDAACLDFLNAFSKILLSSKEAKAFPDVVTLGFWTRRASTAALKKRFARDDGNFRLGRGVVFHIAPSNVPVNYAYSLITGLLTGNANVVRIPSKDFPQIRIISQAFEEALHGHESIRPYLCLVRYERDQGVNDIFSAMSDVRVVWGGDETIYELRRSPLPPRSTEITFANRYSIAVIDSDVYLQTEDKARVAEDFYNDTYLTDQNACTSTKLIVWLGKERTAAKRLFWRTLYDLVKRKYQFQPIMGVNKLTSACRLLALLPGSRLISGEDNILIRIEISSLPEWLIDFNENSGFFLEYDCEDIMELRDICDDTRCQTVGYLGSWEQMRPLLESGVKGIDRIVPIGKTMDFDLFWDGYDLMERMTRVIKIVESNKAGVAKS